MPTSYIDFLYFLDFFGNVVHTSRFNYDDEYFKSVKDDTVKFQYYRKCRDNLWFSYLHKQIDQLPSDTSWINFEEEIGKRVQYNQSMSNWISDLQHFTDCLNFYFYDYINSIEVDVRLPDIVKNEFNYVFSFNYTNTFERLYGKLFDQGNLIEYSYVHGKAGPSAQLVLGCDNSLGDEDFTSNRRYNEMVPFEKTFQRTEKNTDKSFASWFSDNREPFYLHIFGHSLGLTDKSLLIDLINNRYSNLIIYYHSDKKRGELIANLIRMLGVDAYNRKAPFIVFKKQAKVERLSKKAQKFEKLFTPLDVPPEDFRNILNEVNSTPNHKGYVQSLVQRYRTIHQENWGQKKSGDNRYTDEDIAYLTQLCYGEIAYNKDEIIDRFNTIRLKHGLVEDLRKIIGEMNNEVAQARWDHIVQIIW